MKTWPYPTNKGRRMPRGTCRVCLRDYALNSDGTLRSHGHYDIMERVRDWGNRCPGSHQYPYGMPVDGGFIDGDGI